MSLNFSSSKDAVYAQHGAWTEKRHLKYTQSNTWSQLLRLPGEVMEPLAGRVAEGSMLLGTGFTGL